jgi:hypothetical protein
MKTRIEKHIVCANCESVGITDNDCICTYQNKYPTVELEFEVCNCCGNLLNDGQRADTPFNDEQLKKLNN